MSMPKRFRIAIFAKKDDEPTRSAVYDNVISLEINEYRDLILSRFTPVANQTVKMCLADVDGDVTIKIITNRDIGELR